MIYIIVPVCMLYLFGPLSPGDLKLPCNSGMQEHGRNCPFDLFRSFIPDTSIVQAVCIADRITSEEILRLLRDVESQSESPVIREYRFTNPDSSEFLKLVQYPGTGFGKIDEIEVEKPASALKHQPPVTKINISHFQTESGIRLGVSKADLIKIKGIPDTDENIKNINICSYVVNGNDNKFLKRYNMPSYHAGYSFQNDRLIKFTFGFGYP